MTQILKILLEEPQKFEKIFLVIIQILITGGITFLIIGQYAFMNFNSGAFWSFEFLENMPLIGTAGFLLIFVIVWLTIWYLFADVLLIPALSLIFYATSWLISKLIFVPLFLVYPVLYILYLIKLTRKPGKFWEKQVEDDESIESEYVIQQQELYDIYLICRKINNLFNSDIGSKTFIAMTKLDKASIVHARASQYFVALLMVFLHFSVLSKVETSFTIKVLGISTLSILGILVVGVNGIYRILIQYDLRNTIGRARLDVYTEYIYTTLRKSFLEKNYIISKRTGIVSLELKDNKCSELKEKIVTKINFISAENITNEFLYKLLSYGKPEVNLDTERRRIYISRSIPDAINENELIEKNIGFISASSEKELLVALTKIRPYLNKGNSTSK